MEDKSKYCSGNRCECDSNIREIQCEHETRTNEKFTEQRSLGLYEGFVMKRCTNNGTLREDCHTLFEHKRVVCDIHHDSFSKPLDRKCRICGSAVRSCCC